MNKIIHFLLFMLINNFVEAQVNSYLCDTLNFTELKGQQYENCIICTSSNLKLVSTDSVFYSHNKIIKEVNIQHIPEIITEIYYIGNMRFYKALNKGSVLGFGIYNIEDSIGTTYFFNPDLHLLTGICEGTETTPHGLSKTYYDDENNGLYEIGNYEHGKKIGEWRTYYPSGKLQSFYFVGKEGVDGSYTFFYENGNIRAVENYKSSKPDGWWYHYSENGKLIAKYLYSNDELIESEKFD